MTQVQTMKKVNDVNGVSIQERDIAFGRRYNRELKVSTSETPVTNQMVKRINLNLKTEDIKIGTWNIRTMQRMYSLKK